MSASLEDKIRSVQYLLIAKAGLAVSASSTMTLKDLQEEMLRVYGLLVQARLNEGKHNLNISQLWGASIAMHSARFTGDELWRRWKSIKTVITNVIIKTFHGCLGPGLKPPSGRTMEDMLEETKKRLWADKQDQLATDRLSAFLKKNGKGVPVPAEVSAPKPYPAGWMGPWEFLAFLELGPTSASPAMAFNVTEAGVDITTKIGRKRQRAIEMAGGIMSPSSAVPVVVSSPEGVTDHIAKLTAQLCSINNTELTRMRIEHGSPKTKAAALKTLSISVAKEGTPEECL